MRLRGCEECYRDYPISFALVTFKGHPNPLWLPKEVKVTVEWKGRTYRNLHRYSDFRVFKVDAVEKRKPA